ncbi:hypothetical protein CTAYLR_003009 [Chrysophaeum taylorii]|uniref:Hsp90 chaperone protein kinase-targeting subunit n=1 Tax=Chrysophaeum taylorii TaxID=2483200 RepID=A0AAD7U4X9_9STRA|nr:hypothetical protein CTAYLR_003009 [Chrysophaeum taylorii]
MAGHKPFDYSKWDNIEISDDEEDCHPNIDKASWFRMKHRSRVEREDQEEAEKKALVAENETDAKRLKEASDIAEKREIKERIMERSERLEYMERNKKWNVDNICQTASEHTIVSGRGADGSELVGGLKMGPTSEKEAVMSYAQFVEKHEEALEDFLQTVDPDETKKKIHERGDVLLHEHAQSYFLLSCLEDEMNGYPEKMRRAARNSQILSHITELATSMRRHPRDVVLPFFSRIAEPSYKAGFDQAVEGFVERIQKRAVDKRKEMEKDQVELSKEERVGPGGLDPVEVFESLPKSMQEAFEAKDTQMLQVALEAMPIQEAKHHMDRCEASGLWVSNKDAPDDDDDDDDDNSTAAAGSPAAEDSTHPDPAADA